MKVCCVLKYAGPGPLPAVGGMRCAYVVSGRMSHFNATGFKQVHHRAGASEPQLIVTSFLTAGEHGCQFGPKREGFSAFVGG
jgi:hypothetical protein